MSNQVFANLSGRFFPNPGQKDKLTLAKNAGALGYLDLPLTVSGSYLQFNVLNGNSISTVSTYPPAQNISTIPYWTIAPGSGAVNGAPILVSNVNNNVLVSAEIPFWMRKGLVISGGFVRFAACVLDPDNSYSILSSSDLVTSNPFDTNTSASGALTTPLPGGCSISTVVNVPTGKALAVKAYFIYPADYTQAIDLIIQDDAMNTNPAALMIECSLSFQKM